MPIERIEKATVRQLCSGQVITSPVSVVKELVENSLDAGATNIDVTVIDGGTDSIIVSDNGCGINFFPSSTTGVEGDSDIVLLARRASSKQSSLSGNGSTVSVGEHETLGFRGEALHSLAQLAEVKIISRQKGKPSYTAIYDQKESKTIVTMSSPEDEKFESGTTVQVRKLFASIPIRQREMERSSKKHLQHIATLLKGWAVLRHTIQIFAESRVTAGSSTTPTTICSSKGHNSMLNTIGDVFGGRVSKTLKAVEWSCADGIVIKGYVSDIGHGRLTADLQFITLDGRLVDCKRWTKVISDTYLMCHPHTSKNIVPALFLEISSNNMLQYDINVAPDKKQVLTNDDAFVNSLRTVTREYFQRCSDTTAVGYHTTSKISGAASKNNNSNNTVMVPISANAPAVCYPLLKRKRLEDENEDTDENRPTREVLDANAEGGHRLSKHQISPIIVKEKVEVIQKQRATVSEASTAETSKKGKKYSHLTSKNCEEELEENFTKSSFSTATIVGQYNKGFIVIVNNGDVFVVDQHAADEKFNYERLRISMETPPQTLLAPARIDMEQEEIALCLEAADELRKHGFIVEADSSSTSTLLVKSVPVLPYDTVVPADIRELSQQLLAEGRVVKQLKARWHSIATKACRTSIMIGTVLDASQQNKVVRNLANLEQPWNCPHGRPTMRHVGCVSNNATDQNSVRKSPKLTKLLE